MRTDPNTKRARDVVWLVVFTVALPSILLTALGAVAVKNEEAAARERLETLYRPAMKNVAESFNGLMDDMVEASSVPLRELVMLAEAENENAIPQVLDRFRGTYGFTTNYFVVNDDGEILVPRSLETNDASCMTGPTSVLPLELADAIRAQEMSGVLPACSKLDAMLKPEQDGSYSCAIQYAAASCRVARGELSPADALAKVCDVYRDHPATELALELRADHRARASVATTAAAVPEEVPPPEERKEVSRKRRALFEALSDPMIPAPAFFTEAVARDAMVTIVPELTQEYPRWRVAFYTLTQRPVFLKELARTMHPYRASARMTSVKTDNWRRVHVRRSISGMTAGFELVPPMVEPALTTVLATLGLSDDLVAMANSIDLPKGVFPRLAMFEGEEKRVTNFAIMKKSDLSWQLALALGYDSAFFSLHASRSTLYFWALILMATALVFGLGYTVWAVIREARLSRLKTDFVSSVSHDLRTPLTSIRMFTEMLLMERVQGKEDERECLEVIAKETERLTRLTERILDFSRMEAGRKAYTYEPIDVEPVIQEALEACRPLMTHGDFDVVVDMEPGLPRMCADRDAMIEVLMNLISNAVKYSPDDHFIAVRAKREDGTITLSVVDHGMGIPKLELKRIFEKFHRVDCRRTSEVSGSGIGLSLVQHIVNAHDGSIEVKSTPGRGSTFTVKIPAEGARKSVTAAEALDGAHTGYRGRPIDSPGTV